MNITGIITEYNPFHNGHELHLKNAILDTNCDGIVCVMSGNFMQRGNPAIIDKWNRAKMAVLNGVDLVIELPTIYSLSSAEIFSYGGIKLLNEMNVVNSVYFGSECGDIDSLKEIATILSGESLEFKKALKEELNLGNPFHLARVNALKKISNMDNLSQILSSSNNILGIEYLKALNKLNSCIKPVTLKRNGSNYNDKFLTSTYSSATAIRESLKNDNDLNKVKNFVPDLSFEYLLDLKNNGYNFTFSEKMFPFIKHKLLTSENSLSNLYDVNEGLDKRILKALLNSSNLEELIINSKSKRYTYTRISRILAQLYVGLDNSDLKNIIEKESLYVRPLAFNKNGAKILKEIKNSSKLNIITKVPKHINNEMLKIDILGTKAYSILNPSISPNEDYFKSPIVI